LDYGLVNIVEYDGQQFELSFPSKHVLLTVHLVEQGEIGWVQENGQWYITTRQQERNILVGYLTHTQKRYCIFWDDVLTCSYMNCTPYFNQGIGLNLC
jgi:hypothetical protein